MVKNRERVEESVNKKNIVILALASLIGTMPVMPAFAMDAPGSGGNNWYYSDKNHHWYYYNEDRSVHTGWLFYEGEWYWFDSDGWMEASGYANIDGVRYYFFSNGQMAYNQYVGLKYMNKDGQEQEENNIRVIGRESPTSEDRDMITDALYEVPRGWFAEFEKDGWQLMFYKQKKYFAAPDTDLGIYYVYHSVDTRYKKVKFTDTDSLLQAFGTYVGYAAGLYEEGDPTMQRLWAEQITLNNILNIPDYYSGDAGFYFGKLFAAYLDPVDRESMERISPQACEIMGDILHMKDEYPEVYQKQKEREARERQERALKEAEIGGPGVEQEKEGGDMENP